MYPCMLTFSRWLSHGCPAVCLVHNWHMFGGPGLIKRDGIRPSLDGVALVSSNLAIFLF